MKRGVFQSMFSRTKDQLRLDSLNVELKETKEQLRQELKATHEYFLDIYGNKLSKYQSQLVHYEKTRPVHYLTPELETYTFFQIPVQSVDHSFSGNRVELYTVADYYHKRHILAELVRCSYLLTQKCDLNILHEFSLLESEYNGIFYFENPCFISWSEFSYLEKVERVKEVIWEYIAEIRQLAKKLLSVLVRDLRQIFRSMIRFHFKNLDDADESNVLINPSEYQLLLIQHSSNEKLRNNKGFTAYT